jgi:chemotaxis signal transduction protein
MNRTDEFMTATTGTKSEWMKSIEVLLFNIQMNNYGIPVYQIDQILERDPCASLPEAVPPVMKVDQVLLLPDSGMYLFPSWLKLKAALNSSLASAILMIDGMSGIIEIQTSQIRRLPKLIARHLNHQWIWGAALPADETMKDVILLLDFNATDHTNRLSSI